MVVARYQVAGELDDMGSSCPKLLNGGLRTEELVGLTEKLDGK
jgi:hypothetical protein